MREYTTKQIKQLKSNKYTLNVTKNKLYFTAEFKEAFWIRYQVGDSPRKIIVDLGYDIKLFQQKQLDSLVQRIKKQALSGAGFTEGENRTKRVPIKKIGSEHEKESSLDQMQHELLYLRQEVEFLKKIIKADKSKRKD
jgi:hypothetical protein